MRIFGADLSRELPDAGEWWATLVLLDARGAVATIRHPGSLTEAARDVVELAAGEPFLVGVNLPVVVPNRAQRTRPIEGLLHRRLGVRLPPGGRASLAGMRTGVPGDALLAAFAASGQPCLPYPDRDRRRSGIAEVHPSLVLKALLWSVSRAAQADAHPERERLFRAIAPPAHRAAGRKERPDWAERHTSLDLLLRSLVSLEGYDLETVASRLAQAASEEAVERVASLFDAVLIAGTARRYLEEPEACAFVGERSEGYAILPADGFLRRLALRETSRTTRAPLFPRASLRDRLSPLADLNLLGLLDVPGRPQQLQAVFHEPPLLEFDNVDEMLWWKHVRQLSGPSFPTEGLREMMVELPPPGGAEAWDRGSPLRLLRSRHRTLSFRFEPPAAWRARVPTRDGKVYPFRVLRAIYETMPEEA